MINTVIPMVLGMTALCMLLVAVFSALQGRRVRLGAQAAEGVVDSWTPETPTTHARPRIRFTTPEGETVIVPAQVRDRVSRHVAVGEQVMIQYVRGKALGMDRWSVFIVRDRAAKPWRIYTVLAGVLAVAAAALLVVGAVVLLG